MESCKRRTKQAAAQLGAILDELGNVGVIHTAMLCTMLGLALKNIDCIVCLLMHGGYEQPYFALLYGFLSSHTVGDSRAKAARNLGIRRPARPVGTSKPRWALVRVLRRGQGGAQASRPPGCSAPRERHRSPGLPQQGRQR